MLKVILVAAATLSIAVECLAESPRFVETSNHTENGGSVVTSANSGLGSGALETLSPDEIISLFLIEEDPVYALERDPDCLGKCSQSDEDCTGRCPACNKGIAVVRKACNVGRQACFGACGAVMIGCIRNCPPKKIDDPTAPRDPQKP